MCGGGGGGAALGARGAAKWIGGCGGGGGRECAGGDLSCLFNFDFLVFFGLALRTLGIAFPLSGGPMNWRARRTASVPPSGAGSMANRAATLADVLGVNRNEFGRDLWG